MSFNHPHSDNISIPNYYITICCDLWKGQSLSNIWDIFFTPLMGHVLNLSSHNGLFPLWGSGTALFKLPWTRGRYDTRYLHGEKKCQEWKGFRSSALKIVCPSFVKVYSGWPPCVTHISLKGTERKEKKNSPFNSLWYSWSSVSGCHTRRNATVLQWAIHWEH